MAGMLEGLLDSLAALPTLLATRNPLAPARPAYWGPIAQVGVGLGLLPACWGLSSQVGDRRFDCLFRLMLITMLRFGVLTQHLMS